MSTIRHNIPRLLLALLCIPLLSDAATFTINTPGGPIEVELSHIDASGELVSPSQPGTPGFRPPTIFSAPLPSGSGARALGQSGAFTAIADDATAASWNPAGLVQLERPEASFVTRFSYEENKHHSGAQNYRVGSDEFDSLGLNYLSTVLPFYVADRNVVVSLNYQEVYDFEQSFSADLSESSSSSQRGTAMETRTGTQVDRFSTAQLELTVTSELTTQQNSMFNQILNYGTVSDLDFEQEGMIDALTPAVAFEITPKLAVGVAFNVYQDSLLGDRHIRSSTVARYSGTSSSIGSVRDMFTTSGTYGYVGTVTIPGGGGLPPLVVPVSDTGTYPSFSDTQNRSLNASLNYEGIYRQTDRFEDLSGFNATFGALWTVSSHLGLGATLDLPWTAEADQTRIVDNTVTTRDSDGRIVDVITSSASETKQVEFDFPLYWSLGAVWRWTPLFFTALDVSSTHWSDFSYKAEGEQRLNPLDGSAYGANELDDCWAVRFGAEYLFLLKQTEIPLRAGVSWEQRPAIGSPDEYWGASLGSGISLGRDPGKVIIDIAYMFNWGDDVLGTLIPERDDLTTDVYRHDIFVSFIVHL